MDRTLDYEKPEALAPHIFPQNGSQSPQPDVDGPTLNNFVDEPTPAEERRELRGESLWYARDWLL